MATDIALTMLLKAKDQSSGAIKSMNDGLKKSQSAMDAASVAAKRLDVAKAALAVAMQKVQQLASKEGVSVQQLQLAQAKAALASERMTAAKNQLAQAENKASSATKEESSVAQQAVRATDQHKAAVSRSSDALKVAASIAKSALTAFKTLGSGFLTVAGNALKMLNPLPALTSGLSLISSSASRAVAGLSSLGHALTSVASSGFGAIRSAATGAVSAMGSFVSSIARGAISVVDFGAKLGQTIFGLKELASTAISMGSAFLQPAANMEQTQTAFTTLLHSGNDATKMIKDLYQFGANTPFEFADLADTAKTLLAMGNNADSIMPLLTDIGETVSALGLNSGELNNIAFIFGQMGAAGRTTTGDLNQLAERGIPVWKYLAQSMGMTTEQVRNMVESGALSADDAIRMIRGGMQEFKGGMEAQSKTFNGLLSTLKDNATSALLAFSGPAFELAKKGLEQLNKLVGSKAFQDFAKSAGEALGKALNNMVDLIQSRLIPAIERMGPILSEWKQRFQDALNSPVLQEFKDRVQDLAIAALHELVNILESDVIPTVRRWTELILRFLSSPQFAQFRARLETGILAGFQKLHDLIMNQIVPTLSRFWTILTESQAGQIFMMTMLNLGQALTDLMTAASPLQNFLKDVQSGMSTANGPSETFQNILSKIAIIIQTDVLPVINSLTGFFQNVMPPAMSIVMDGFDGLMGALDQIKQPVIDLIDTVSPLLGKLLDWIDKNDILKKSLLFVGALLASIITGVRDMVIFLVPIIVEQLIPTLGRLNDALGPVLVRFGEWSTKGGGVALVFQILGFAIGGVINFVAGLMDLLAWVVNGVGFTFHAFGLTVDFVFKFIQGIIGAFPKWFNDRVNEVRNFFATLPGNLQNIAKDIWNRITGALSNLSNWVKVNVWDKLPQGLKDAFSGVADTIGGIFSGIGDGIRWAINGVIEIVNGAINNINGVSSKVGISLPTIPHLAQGTEHARSGVTLVGEDGPELVYMHGGERVVPNNRLGSEARLMSPGGGGATTVVNHIHIHVDGRGAQTDRELVEMVMRAFDRKLSRSANMSSWIAGGKA